jgi:hypothetical protein
MSLKQSTQILIHLRQHGDITPLEALGQYRCFRLAARINDLRKDGYRIITEAQRGDGKRWARYRLVET